MQIARVLESSWAVASLPNAVAPVREEPPSDRNPQHPDQRRPAPQPNHPQVICVRVTAQRKRNRRDQHQRERKRDCRSHRRPQPDRLLRASPAANTWSRQVGDDRIEFQPPRSICQPWDVLPPLGSDDAGLLRKERPFFEGGAQTAGIERDDPEVAIRANHRFAVLDLDPCDGCAASCGDDLGCKRECLGP